MARAALVVVLIGLSSSALLATVGLGLARQDFIVVAADSLQVDVRSDGTTDTRRVCKVGGTRQVIATVAGLTVDGDFDAMAMAEAVASKNTDAFQAMAQFKTDVLQRLPAVVARQRDHAAFKDWTERKFPVTAAIFASFTHGRPQLERCAFSVDSLGRPREPSCDRSPPIREGLDHQEIGRAAAVNSVLTSMPGWRSAAASYPARFVYDVILRVSVMEGVNDVGPPITVVRLDFSGAHVLERGICHFDF